MNAYMQTPNTKPLNFLFVQHIPPDDLPEEIVVPLDDAMVNRPVVITEDLLWDQRLWYPVRHSNCVYICGEQIHEVRRWSTRIM